MFVTEIFVKHFYHKCFHRKYFKNIFQMFSQTCLIQTIEKHFKNMSEMFSQMFAFKMFEEKFLKCLWCNHLLIKPFVYICEMFALQTFYKETFMKYLKGKPLTNIVVTHILNTNTLRDLLCRPNLKYSTSIVEHER